MEKSPHKVYKPGGSRSGILPDSTQNSSLNTFKRIYEAVRLIPKGKVTTYGEIAEHVGLRDVRVVGWALNKNPDPTTIPCHRVVNKQGRVSSAFAFGGENQQVNLLKKEGVKFKNNFEVNLDKHLHTFGSFSNP